MKHLILFFAVLASMLAFGKHGLKYCGYKGCHGQMCQRGGTSSSSSTYGQGLQTIRTVNNSVNTYDRHRLANAELEYKKLRNERMRKENEAGAKISQPIVIEEKGRLVGFCNPCQIQTDISHSTCPICGKFLTEMEERKIGGNWGICQSCGIKAKMIKTICPKCKKRMTPVEKSKTW